MLKEIFDNLLTSKNYFIFFLKKKVTINNNYFFSVEENNLLPIFLKGYQQYSELYVNRKKILHNLITKFKDHITTDSKLLWNSLSLGSKYFLFFFFLFFSIEKKIAIKFLS